MIAIVDHGLGNLYSVERACRHVGLDAAITANADAVAKADGIIVPGVGAFGDAMATMTRLGLAEAIRKAAAAGTPIMGVCLGIQLLMRESSEFGRHEGLGILDGTVIRIPDATSGGRRMKVPAVCWNRLTKTRDWSGTPMEDLRDGAYLYFVHSYCVQPADPSVILSTTRYGDFEYASSIGRGNVFACQFHPERSGPEGLGIYRKWGRRVRDRRQGT